MTWNSRRRSWPWKISATWRSRRYFVILSSRFRHFLFISFCRFLESKSILNHILFIDTKIAVLSFCQIRFCRFVESPLHRFIVLTCRWRGCVLSFYLCYGFVVFLLTIKILVNFTYLRRAVIVDCKARIRERRGALLFALKEESAAKRNRRRFLSFTSLTLINGWLPCKGRGRNPTAGRMVTWGDPVAWGRRTADTSDHPIGRLGMLEKERVISHNLAVRSGWNFEERLIALCSSHLYGWDFHRTLEALENQSRPSDWEEALTPKSAPPPLRFLFVFWLSLDTRSPAGKGEKLRPKLSIIGCLSLFWRRRTRGDHRRSESSTTRPRIGTNTGFVGRFWGGILL